MKQDYMRFFYREMIRRGFLPIPEKDGAPGIFSEQTNILLRRNAGREQILILADGDGKTDAGLAEYLEKQDEAFQQSPDALDVLYLFVFDRAPDEEKIKALHEAARRWTVNRKYVTVIAAQLDEKRLAVFRKVPGGLFGIRRTARKAFGAHDVALGDEQELVRGQQEKLKFAYRAKTPVVTWALVALNVLIFVAMSVYCWKTGVSNDAALTQWGSKDNLLILQGQWWRLISSTFLHGSVEHIGFNAISLYFLGVMAERIYGHGRFAAVYMLAGLCGSLMSFAFSTSSSVGASGAIFGIMGALAYFGIEKPAVFRSSFGAAVILIIAVNLINGVLSANIDNFGHIGGLIGGFLFAGALYPGRTVGRMRRLAPAAAGVVFAVGLLGYGLTNDRNAALPMVSRLEQLMDEKRWAQAQQEGASILSRHGIDTATRGEVLWDVCRAQFNGGNDSAALSTAKELTRWQAADGHYLQGLIYLSGGQYAEARQELTAAKRMGAQYANLDELLRDAQNSGK